MVCLKCSEVGSSKIADRSTATADIYELGSGHTISELRTPVRQDAYLNAGTEKPKSDSSKGQDCWSDYCAVNALGQGAARFVSSFDH